MEWIQTHWLEIGAAVASLIVLADMVAKWTATDKDDKIIAKIKAVIPVFWPKGK